MCDVVRIAAKCIGIPASGAKGKGHPYPPRMGEWHLRSPKRVAFARVVIAGLGGFIALGAAFAVVPDIVKQDMHQTDVVVGWTLTVFAATALATRFFAGVGIDRRGARAIFALGFLLLAVSGGLFLLITPDREWLLFGARALQGAKNSSPGGGAGRCKTFRGL